jgi:hypothetical protein
VICNQESADEMLTLLIATILTFFVRGATIRLSIVSFVSVSVIAFVAASDAKAEEGLIRGSLKTVIHELDGQRQTEQLDFILACDRDCCLTGTNYRQEKFEPLEQFSLANKGNEFGILITVDRREGNPLTIDGKWSAKYLQELRKLKLNDTFESRYNVVEMGSNALIALPVYLSWNSVGVTRDTMLSALRGTNYRGSNELGSLEIVGTQGIGRITLKKSPSSLLSPRYLPLSELSGPYYPNGLTSMVQEYSFSPERRFGEHEPFRCAGTTTETVPDGRSRKTEIEIQVTEYADSKTASKFINALLGKLPNNKRIINDSGINVATVLDKGKQKVVVDRDVERLTEPRFNNESTSIYYYVIVLFFLAILGMIGYLRWAQKAS